MALFRKFFYRKPPDGLLEIVERVYVFDYCFTTDVVEDEKYKDYIGGIIGQLRGHLPDASFMVFNFREGEHQSQIANILSEYDMTVIDYPRQYEGCPLLNMEMVHHCLRSGESWLLLGNNNVLLMHCERGGWPILSFMLAALLIYRKLYSGEQKTLDMIHKQAPRELLQLMSPLNPIPSQLRYLQYVSRRNLNSEWPPLDQALTLDCMMLRHIPNMDGLGGCRPIIRIYGKDPAIADERTPKVLFSTPKRSRVVRYYKQAESELVKIDVHCHILGDVVLECISLDDDMEREQMMFRVMFNTAFIRSNILMLGRDEIDTLWACKDNFPKDFRTELIFSEMDASSSDDPVNSPVTEEKEGLPVEAFAKVQEIFSNVDWMDSKSDVALNVLQHITASALLKDKSENSPDQKAVTGILDASSPRELEKQLKLQVLENSTKGSPSKGLEKVSEQFSEAILDTGLLGPITGTRQENASIVALPNQETAKPIAETGSDSVSSPQEVNKANYEASKNVIASSSMIPCLEITKIEKTGQRGDLVPTLQHSKQSKIISPRIVQSPRSGSNSLSGSPMQRFQNSSSSLGITALLDDHDTYKKDKVSQSVAEVPQPSATPASSVIEGPELVKKVSSLSSALPLSPPPPPPPPPLLPSELHITGKTSMSPPPPPPPPPPPFSRASTSESPSPPFSRASTSESDNDVSLHSETQPSGKSHLKPLVSPPPSSPQASPSIAKKTSMTPPPPPPPPPLLAPSKPSSPLKADTTSAPPPPPPPPPSFGRSPSLKAGSTSSAPPPPPPPPVKPSPSGVGNAPPPPPPPPPVGKAPPPPPPPKLSSSAPPPPPPPRALSGDVGSTGSSKVPPVPPPLGKGLINANGASQSNGPVPPPPGPPGTKGRAPPRLTPRNPGQSKKPNLKPYHWLKITRVMQGSLWADASKPDEAAKAPEIDISELENLFAASVPNSEKGNAGGKSARRAAGPKTDKVQLIELRRAYNCEIMLSKVKIPLPDLMNSVLALDDSALDVDQVENLIKFCPTKEEMELLKNYKGDKENLGKCEQFFLELMKVPRVESKLRVFSFKIQFNSQVSDLRKNLKTINSASEEIRTSTKLKRIMQTILSLGNALNHGTARGSAVGFRLDSLLKLTDTRARNNKMTLMHYLCKVLAEKLPELLDFPKDLTSLEASTKIQLKFLAEEMQAISKGLEKVVQELSNSGNDGPVSENFCKILKHFLGHAEGEVRSLASLYSTVGRNADALAMYFGEDPAKCPFEQVVSTLLNFVRMFVRAHEENCKQLEFEKKKAQKEAENDKTKMNARGKDFEQHVRSPEKSGIPK